MFYVISLKRLGCIKETDIEHNRSSVKEDSCMEIDQRAIEEAKKHQEESVARMSRHHIPIGLPKSVNLRDGPLVRAQAFLNEKIPAIE